MNKPKILQSQIRDVKFGLNVTVIEPANIYECEIGDSSFIGPFVEIQKGVVIGKRCRIQSHAFVCELVTIGDDCVISHGVMFINDPYKIGGPARGGPDALEENPHRKQRLYWGKCDDITRCDL